MIHASAIAESIIAPAVFRLDFHTGWVIPSHFHSTLQLTGCRLRSDIRKLRLRRSRVILPAMVDDDLARIITQALADARRTS